MENNLGFIGSFCGSQYFLFYLDEGSGDEPDEGYRFGNIGELIALRYYLFTMIDYRFDTKCEC